AGLNVAQRSVGEPVTDATEVYLADTLGELGLFFRVAPVAFIGNSLVDGGGHNPQEAVELGAAVLSGPFVKNFADVFQHLERSVPGPDVRDAATLASAVVALLADPEATRARHAKQAAVFTALTGALDRTMTALAPYLAP